MTTNEPQPGTLLERLVPATSPVTTWLHPARALLALATLLTLAVNSGPTLFHSSDPVTAAAPECSGVPAVGLFCLIPDPDVARWIGAGLLCTVLAGLFPPVTAVLHWYVSVSVFWTITPMEGGDQLAAIVTLMLIPVCLTDTRWMVWRHAPKPSSRTRNIIGNTALLLIAAQLVIVYANSAIAKFSSAPWVEGTALWYWMQHPAFGAPAWLSGPALDLLAQPLGTALLTWGTIALELVVTASIFSTQRRVRLVGWSLGVLFHLLIAVVIGLVSFGMVMVAALTLVLLARPTSAATSRGDGAPRRQSDQDEPQDPFRDTAASQPTGSGTHAPAEHMLSGR